MAGITVPQLHHLSYDLTGHRFGKLVAIEATPLRKRRRIVWRCLCDCGATKEIPSNALWDGTAKDCGCVKAERAKIAKMPEHQIWFGMIGRCRYSHIWPHHAGRGIKVCERWQTFENFYGDMGPRPSPEHSIDRINNDGDYEPGNCRWATWTEQLRNTRNTRRATLNGETKSLHDWCEAKGLSIYCVQKRLRLGWTVEEALTIPSGSMWRKNR